MAEKFLPFETIKDNSGKKKTVTVIRKDSEYGKNFKEKRSYFAKRFGDRMTVRGGIKNSKDSLTAQDRYDSSKRVAAGTEGIKAEVKAEMSKKRKR